MEYYKAGLHGAFERACRDEANSKAKRAATGRSKEWRRKRGMARRSGTNDAEVMVGSVFRFVSKYQCQRGCEE